ncbi:Uncharacterized protein Fot_22125 [Forsythia ovata]|uniref:Transposase n=1 Tax=Forsythia ovata TaxID=205694 RepID=A0ABD1UWU7_9LAMI
MPVTREGYKSGQASQEKSTQGGGKRSTRNDYGYSEANILNDELEDEHIDDAFHSEDMYRSNNRGRDHSQQRSTQSVGRGSARGNYRETNISNHEVEDEHIDDALYPEDVSKPNKRVMCDSFVEAFVPRDITATMKAYFDGPYPTFRSMPQPIRDGLWDRFLVKYVWPTANTANVYDAWKKTMKDRYKDMMNDARNQAKCKSQSDSLVDWRRHGPPWIRAEHWDSLVNY